jgi:hypothetical protein
MRLSTIESSSESKDLKRFASRHSSAFIDWEIMYRVYNDIYEEIPLHDFLDIISKDYQWYTTFLNNIKIRLQK